jgi:DNA-binding NarL/FixJ family response regulator
MLPDGLGIALALELRSQRPPVPTLLLTGHVDRTAINDAQVAGVEFALKPPSDASLIAFAARAMRDPAAGTPDDSALLVRCVTQYGLTAREAAVLAQALLGLDRDVSARALGMSEGTIKTHITAILRRTSKASMRELVGSLRGNVGDEGETPAAKPSGRGRPTRSGEPGAGGAPGGGSSGPAVDN